jgi:hypothetical protein
MKNLSKILFLTTMVIIIMPASAHSFGNMFYAKYKSYLNLETKELFVKKKEFPDRIKFQEFYVSNCFIKVFIFIDDPDATQTPYQIVVQAWDKQEMYKDFKINSIVVVSSFNNPYRINQNNIWKSDFKGNKSTGFRHASYIFKDNLFFDFDAGEEITVKLNVTVSTGSEEFTEDVEYHFIPVKEKKFSPLV